MLEIVGNYYVLTALVHLEICCEICWKFDVLELIGILMRILLCQLTVCKTALARCGFWHKAALHECGLKLGSLCQLKPHLPVAVCFKIALAECGFVVELKTALDTANRTCQVRIRRKTALAECGFVYSSKATVFGIISRLGPKLSINFKK